jgi:hypothetical protein
MCGQNGYESDYNDCDYHGAGTADYCCDCEQVQIDEEGLGHWIHELGFWRTQRADGICLYSVAPF